ncbi:hypothetical protein ILUMI_02214 [Ignelater luminosus]|uniref:Carboxylic ester hydrolase n=1 Tax=Ignelater luminosus TaxID=2038154 RepID=A0A8K0DIN2_IGNLU|nr:hypothetical protein ILUMI_02214 [Ignelater luminosus]
MNIVMKFTILILVLCGIVLAEDATLEKCVRPPMVTTDLGTIKGVTDRTLFGRQFYSFKGIRYAEPPVGDLRFKPPVPVKSWKGVYDATKDGPACPQPLLRPVSEDCLFLNVHTPRLPRRTKNPKYPVIIYVHPGSLTTLTGNSAAVGGQYLLDQDVVLVTSNYRLSSLGMLSTGDELATGNNALKDQVEVMRWVNKHIKKFGGDPNNVLLAGYSAGGLSVSIHLVSPMSRGLFHKVAIMSGCAFGNNIKKTNLFDLAQKQARIVGCPDDTSANIIKCLKTIPAETLGDTLESFRIFGTDPQFIWEPVIEPDFGQERFLVESPFTSVQCGRIADVPVMTGITSDELIFLAQPVVANDTWLEVLNRDWNKIAPIAFYYDPDAPNVNEKSAELKNFYFNGQPVNSGSLVPLGEIYSDSLSGFGVNRGANVLSRFLSNSVYYYAFTYKGRFSNFNPPGGNDKYVVHFDDMLYAFWNSLQFPKFKKTDPEAATVKKTDNCLV